MTVAEDFTLLALMDVDGKPLIGNLQLECGLAAALLVELAEQGRIDVDGDGIVVRDVTPLGKPDEDAALARIAETKPHDFAWWVSSLRSGLAQTTLARLVAQGVVTEERVRRFGIFSHTRHPLADPGSAHAVRERLSAVLQGESAEPRAVALLSLSHATGLDRLILPESTPAGVEQRLNQLGATATADAVAKVVKNVNAAVVAAVTAATAGI
ncbi:MAG TPA: GPP34 family phosphoprotein [Kineosporiaceae bacterium]|nr:GPP34 family phosphoprotein [Kineosporiaceae bacterium]